MIVELNEEKTKKEQYLGEHMFTTDGKNENAMEWVNQQKVVCHACFLPTTQVSRVHVVQQGGCMQVEDDEEGRL